MFGAHIWLEQAKVFAANASYLCDLADTLLEGFKLLVERDSGSGDNLLVLNDFRISAISIQDI